MDKVLITLTEYVGILKKYGDHVLTKTVVTATSAVRDAANKHEFLRLVEETVGFPSSFIKRGRGGKIHLLRSHKSNKSKSRFYFGY